MKALKRVCGIVLMLMMTVGFMPMMPGGNGVAEAADAEFYAVLNTAAEGTEGQAGYKPAYTLSFYYDGNKSTHTGKTVYDNLPTNATEGPDWGYHNKREDIKNVVIDASVADYDGLKSTAGMFGQMQNADNISGCEYLDVSNVTNMAYMFYSFAKNSTAITAVPDVSGWNTSMVDDMGCMFDFYAYSSTAITAVPDVSGWNTSMVTSMEGMFQFYAYSSKSKLNPLDLSGWDISKLQCANYMFSCYNYSCSDGNSIVFATDWTMIKKYIASIAMFSPSKLKNAKYDVGGTMEWDKANTSNTGCFTKPIASITTQSGTTKYASVQAAVNAATSDPTVKMIADSTENVEIASGKNVTLDLNGHVLKADLSDSKHHSVITNNGTLTIKDTATTNNTHYFKVNANGLWVLDDTLTTADYIFEADKGLKTAAGDATTDIPAKDKVIKVSGGCITGGTGTEDGTSRWCGGGIYNNGTLSLLGGNIVGNNPTTGGGVYNETTKSFTMSAGTIAGNALPDDCGGGVNNCGNINMTGGIIFSNTAKVAGGIYSTLGDLVMTGGNVSGNTATNNHAGVCVDGSNVLLGGTIRISNNTANTAKSNLVLEPGTNVTIGTDANVPKEEMSVGVVKYDDSIHGTGPEICLGIFTTNGTNTDVQYFHSDVDDYAVKFVKGDAQQTDDAKKVDHLELVYAYNVTEATCTNGSVSVGTTKKYAEGDEVTISNTPDNGYIFDKYSVYKTGDETTKVTVADGKFTMPAYDVTVSATFMKPVCFIDSNDNGKFDNDETKYGSIGKAIGTSKPALESESTPTKIVLIANDTENVTIPEGRNITIDLNGHVLKGDGTDSVITNNGTLTIMDSNADNKTHYFTVGNDEVWNWDDSRSESSIDLGPSNPGPGVSVAIKGGAITGGKCSTTGAGGISVSDGAKLVISGGNIVGNSSNNGGGGLYTDDGSIEINGGVIAGNVVTHGGGGVFSDGAGANALKITGGDIMFNQGDYGGGVNSNHSGEVVITGGNIAFNTATDCGGGVALFKKGQISGATITGNIAVNNKGGGIYNDNGTLTVNNLTITENSAASNGCGGGIYTWTDTGKTVEIGSNTKISNNNACWGAGIYNSADYDNEGKPTASTGKLTITNATISGNKAKGLNSCGGGIYNDCGMLTVNATTIDENTTSGSGGGIYTWTIKENKVEIDSNTTISNNKAKWGGGIYNSANYSDQKPLRETGNLTIANTTISGNDATYYGGGLYNSGTASTAGVTIKDNKSEWGGGICNCLDLSLGNDTSVVNNSSKHTDDTKSPSGGVYCWENGGALTLDGKITIDGNTTELSDSSTVKANLCLSGETAAQKLTIGNNFSIEEKKPIGVSVMINDVVGTGAFTTNGTAEDKRYFSSDDDKYYVLYKAGHLELAVKTAPVTSYTVSFDAQGHGTAPSQQTIVAGGKVKEPVALAAEGYVFGGWFKEAECVNAWDFDKDTVTKNTILYAKWTEEEAAPAKEAFIASGTAKGSTNTIKWNAVEGADGYEVYFAKCGKSYKKVKTTTALKYTKKDLNTKYVYKYKVKAYKKVDGEKTYLDTAATIHIAGSKSKYSNATKITVDKTELGLTVGESCKLGAKIAKKSSDKAVLWKNHVSAKVRYKSTDKNVVTVDKSGNVKAVGKGNAYVYAYAANGVYAKVHVSVKNGLGAVWIG